MTNLTVYRENALSDEEYAKLDDLAIEKLSIKPKFIRVVKTKTNEYGETVEYADWVESGYEIFPRGEVPERLLESLQRQTRPKNIALHLHRLAAHKRWGNDKTTWAIVVEDLCNDMASLSEYAIIKACEKFRHDTSNQFFPDTAKLLAEVKSIDWSLRHVSSADSYVKKERQAPVVVPEKTTKSQRMVGKIVRIGMKDKAKWTKWETRFMDAIGKKKA